jgi:hypothetical protein
MLTVGIGFGKIFECRNSFRIITGIIVNLGMIKGSIFSYFFIEFAFPGCIKCRYSKRLICCF